VNVVVTGAAGFLGAAVAARIAAHGNIATGYDRIHGGPATNPARILDLLETDDAFRWPADAQTVVHLAGTWTPAAPTADGLAAQMRANVETTARALAACGPAVRRFVYVSSMSVYGADAVAPFRESVPAAPDSFYGRTKWLGEQVARVACETRPEIALVVLRLAQVYGPGAPPRVVMYDFIGQALTAGAIRARCAAELLRDHLHLDDAADAVAVAAERAPPGTYNVGCGGHTMGDLAEAVRGASPRPVSIGFGGAPGTAKAMDASAFRAATGFAPRVPLAEGVRREYARLAAERSAA
jgi:nucleoside-diphosphate-sugar epimerase